MSDLPDDRFFSGPAFTYVGVFVLAPLSLRMVEDELKRYGQIFTYLTSRIYCAGMPEDTTI